ncbi:hypothetical protein COO60DRAFT_906792 [Scenedesmus sp. NREL 46B-D3]|nr:hypothetical protein COO60DRAFT_906792 [Scenedesmus sp. NREL 46B-D3]
MCRGTHPLGTIPLAPGRYGCLCDPQPPQPWCLPQSTNWCRSQMDGSTMLGNTLRVDRANERKERPAFDSSRAPPSRFEDTRGGYGGGERRERKPVGYRCRIMGLARDVGWQLLKDFLRQAGDVTYANVDPDGMGVGEYQSLSECKDAIEKLSGAALEGKIVKLTPLNFDFDTGERLDRSGGDRGGGGGGGYSSRGYDDRGRNDYGGRKDYDRRDDRRDDRDRRDYGGGGSRDYDRCAAVLAAVLSGG